MSDEYVSYKTPSIILAETVYHFLRGSLYGAAYGLVTPFHPPGSAAALKEAATGIFKPAAPFSSLSSVPHNALIFGSLLGVQRFGCKTAEFARGRQDPWNDVIGFVVAYPYYEKFLTTRAVLHNRVVGGAIIVAVGWSSM